METVFAEKLQSPERVPHKEQQSKLIRALPPAKNELFTIRLLVSFGVATMLLFLWWFINRVQVGYTPLYWLLTAALVFKLMRMLHEWIHYAGISVPERPRLTRLWKVDMLTTFCPGEPYEMILNTLKAMKAITYPHTTYLCDEADDPYLKEQCRRLGVIHVTRKEKINAKAGNINNALKMATGEICVVLDPDHVPTPNFIDRVLPYFENPEIGFVQVVQAYGNQKESFVAYGAAEQTYSFYGPMMMSMNRYGTAQAIGANCTFRREALDSIGGHAAGLSEDMHTAMQLHAKGWKSVYVPEIVARGLVPGTLPAYYKQQLKWSRGTFELLVTSYIRLFAKFTWQQKLHYFTIPLYYLFGIFGLVDILIPIIALLTASVPWKVEVSEFALFFLPLFALSLLIRQFAQRWLLEENERGFHVIGGLLRMGTWWVFTLGLVYTILRIKVPYIPTPKDDKPQNNLVLSLPNLIACLGSVAAVMYGLSIDWNPYSFAMAGFAMTNAVILGFVVLMGQEKFIKNVHYFIKNLAPLNYYLLRSRVISWKMRHVFYGTLRKWSLLMVFLIGVVSSYTWFDINQHAPIDEEGGLVQKETGGFFTGVYIPAVGEQNNLAQVEQLEKLAYKSFDIVSIYEPWGPESLENFPMDLLHAVANKGGVPMITWEPWSSNFPTLQDHPDLGKNRHVMAAIVEGVFDDYIKQYAAKIRAYKKPIYIRFAQEPDNPAYPWSMTGGNTSNDFIRGWQHIVHLFVEAGVSNVSWVWNPGKPGAIADYNPGLKYFDWVGVTCLNDGTASTDDKWRNFEDIYHPFRKAILELNKPVMLAEFGSAADNASQTKWISHALGKIGDNEYSEIRALIYYYSNEAKSRRKRWTQLEASSVDWTFDMHQITNKVAKSKSRGSVFFDVPINRADASYTERLKPLNTLYKSKHISGTPGNFELLVDGKPFYIKGLAYNAAHDWRDGHLPLTRKQLDKDFIKIKEMGANTIRRYGIGAYDHNILKRAQEHNLKVIYGFWLAPDVDYYKDSVQVKKYIKEVEDVVKEYKDYSSVLAWSIGNETWGLLKLKYEQPYLSLVRQSYVRLIEHLAQRIHEIDPDRPVTTSFEHAPHTPTEVAAFHDDAPSLDFIGINSYYVAQLSTLNKITSTYDSTRPYYISEFGPNGYWDDRYTAYDQQGAYLEQTDHEKAVLYYIQWKKYIEGHKGHNVGGVAYSWRDRFEGSATWFGITDFDGNIKPSYYSLQRAWTGFKDAHKLHDAFIAGPGVALKPGQVYEFKAVSENNLHKALKFEWFMCRNEFIYYKGELELSSDGHSVRVRIPEEPSNYRLYLKIKNDDGNVVSASVPIRVKRENLF
jgi:cellulose synthase (UDP-forming)